MADDEKRARTEAMARAEELVQRTRRNRSQSERLQQQSIDVAELVAATEEDMAATFDRLAADSPPRAGYLKGLSTAARKNAARERQWLEDQARG